jgi:hypothetical protein
MTAESESPRVVGLRHIDERVEYDRGWTENGMPPAELMDVQDIDDFSMRAASRLVRTDSYEELTGNSATGQPLEELEDAAHQSTKSSDLRAAHMYLVCKAGTA